MHPVARSALGVLVALTSACAPSSPVAQPATVAAVLERVGASGAVVVHDVPPGRAADRAGLRVGDRVKMIDGVHVDDLDLAGVVRLLRGPVGSRASLTVVRGEAVLELVVVREPRGRSVEAVPDRQRVD